MNYVIAASRPWYWAMAAELEAGLGRPFALIRNPDELRMDRLLNLKPRYVFFPHWSTRIPQEIYDAFECVIFHMTDLPFGRGGSPLQNLIVRGIRHTQISALRCTSVVDGGPIYLKRPLSLEGSAREIFGRAAVEIRSMIEYMSRHEPSPSPQSGEVTTFRRRTPAESDLAPLETLSQVYDHIRMLDADGYPHAFMETSHLHVEFTQAAVQNDAVTAVVTIKRKK